MTDEKAEQTTPVIVGDRNDLEYYRVVRMTLSNLDSVRLQASTAGLTMSAAFLGVGYAAWRHAPEIRLLGLPIDLGALLAIAACVLAITTAVQFLRKVELFNDFIEESVDVASMLEKKLLDDESYRLTARFETKASAGARGLPLFKKSLYMLLALACFGILIAGVKLFDTFGLV